MILYHLIISFIILSFVLTVENLFKKDIEDDGNELTKHNNMFLIGLASFIPIVNIGLTVFYIAKYVVFLQIKKERREV